MRSRTWDGGSLIPADEVESRIEAEKADRAARFAQGATAIDRASGGMGAPSTREEPVIGGQLLTDPDLDARFAALNSRYAE